MATNDLVKFEAMGLPADWLNAWLAAIGVTVILPDVKLSWTDEVVPHAAFWRPPGMDLPSAIHEAMPTESDLADSPIAPEGSGGTLGQKVASSDLYAARAEAARLTRSDALSSTLTDLAHEDIHGASPTPVARGQFCVGMEGAETLWKRLLKCVAAVQGFSDPADSIALTLAGSPRRQRISANGLGFDPRRLPSGITENSGAVDPVIEVLAYLGTLLLPVRGSGKPRSQAAQKPWIRDISGRDHLTYHTWQPALDRWGVDAILDRFAAIGNLRTDEEIARFRVRKLRAQSGTKKAAYFSEPVA